MLINSDFSNQLFEILKNMKSIIEKILMVEDLKYETIKDMNIDQLLILNAEADDLLYQMGNLEVMRIDIIESMSLTIGFDSQLPISNIIAFLPKELGNDILVVSMDIKKTCNRLDVITERNEYLLTNHMEIISQMLDLLSGSSNDQYNKNGLTAETRESALHMLNQLV